MAKKADDKDSLLYKAYRFRIYPNQEQREYFAKCFGCARYVYNQLLDKSMKHYEETKNHKIDSYKSLFSEAPWLKEVDSNALNYAKRDLKDSFERFFKKQTQKPRFKSRKDSRQSYTTYRDKSRENLKIIKGKLLLPKMLTYVGKKREISYRSKEAEKLSLVKIKMHRSLPINASIQTATISQTPSGKYYVSILVEYENQVIPIIPQNFIGLDYAMDGLYVDSNGDCANLPKFMEKKERKLRSLQRKLARQLRANTKAIDKNGRPQYIRPLKECKNIQKTKHMIALLHEKITNQRNDMLHKLSYRLVNQYDYIGIEDISVKDMAKRKTGGRFSFGKSVANNGWAMFTTMLAYKLSWQGKTLIKVDKFFPSSKTCRFCGHVDKGLKLSERKWTCLHCGSFIEHRDVNAAINIREEAKRILREQPQDSKTA